MQYANINTQEIINALPSVLILPGQTITGATIEHWKALGWRQVSITDAPATGYRVTAYGVQDIDGLNCRLTVASSVNISAEAAANAAAQAAQSKADAKTMLAGSSDQIQRALRAFAELTLQEINTLRTKASLSTYTWAQFLAAMQAKIDAQS